MPSSGYKGLVVDGNDASNYFSHRNKVITTITYQASVNSHPFKIRWSSLSANIDTNEMNHRLWWNRGRFRLRMDDECVACVARMEV